MPRQGREYFGVDGVEEPLDLASALGPADGGVDDADLQGDRGVFEMVTGEVTSVVDVESVGHAAHRPGRDRKSTRLNSSHVAISYAVFCLKKKNIDYQQSN